MQNSELSRADKHAFVDELLMAKAASGKYASHYYPFSRTTVDRAVFGMVLNCAGIFALP